VDGQFKERDYCILTIFLNCGLRVSELVGLNLGDIQGDSMIVTGKGNKERMVYLNAACIDALNAYLPVRPPIVTADRNALFISRQNNRISVKTVQWLVKKYILSAGLDPERYSVHKLRHTAATLMYQNGVDVRTLQELLGHENLDTTKIYTHVDSSQMREAVAANPLANLKAPPRSVIPKETKNEKDKG
jgi:site-specific recombinase XerD